MPTSLSSSTNESERRACPHCCSVFRQRLARCPRDGAALAPLIDDPLVGTVVVDRYSILECVGEGGMGRVYRAEHENMPRPFAIKVLFGDLAADETMRARFRSEAAAAARLNHRNIVGISDFGETSAGLLFIAMEFVDGMSLTELVRTAGVPTPARTAGITTQIAAGLDHAHRRGLIHRDLKMDNILIARDGVEDVVKIVDFGIALARDTEGSRRLTHDGVVVGTPDIMSPEQLTGSAIDHRADLFALGVVVYELLAGKVPFDGAAMEVARQNLSTAPPPIAERSPEATAPAEFEAIAMRLMSKRPGDRFQTAKEVARAFEVALASVEGRPAPPQAPFGSDEELRRLGTDRTLEVRPPARSRPALIALVVLALAAFALAYGTRSRPAATTAVESAPALSHQTPVAPDGSAASIGRNASVDAGVDARLDAALVPRSSPVRRRSNRQTRSAPSAKRTETMAAPAIEPAKKPEDVYESRY